MNKYKELIVAAICWGLAYPAFQQIHINDEFGHGFWWSLTSLGLTMVAVSLVACWISKRID
jgi:hypothetical protein